MDERRRRREHDSGQPDREKQSRADGGRHYAGIRREQRPGRRAWPPENITGYTKILLDRSDANGRQGVQRQQEPRAARNRRAVDGRRRDALHGAQQSGQVRVDGIVQRRLRDVAGRRRLPPATGGPGAAPAGPPAGAAGDGRGRGASRTMDAGVFDKNFPTLDAKANSQIRLLWITCGTADSLIGVNRQFKDWLRSKHVQFAEEEDSRHWSRLAALAPEPHVVRAACVPTDRQTLSLNPRGFAPRTPYTRPRSPLRRLAPVAWLARSQCSLALLPAHSFMR